MIGKLRGIVDDVHEDSAVIDVGGVGYVVFASSSTLQQLESFVGQDTVSLVIETHVREDHIHLFGFLSVVEREWFRLLIKVQGVGAKMALAILSVLKPEELVNAIGAGDSTTLTRANGVGKKLAERLVTELKTKVAKMPLLTAEEMGLPKSNPATTQDNNAQEAATPIGNTGNMHVTKNKKTKTNTQALLRDDAISALVNLGYPKVDAFSAVSKSMHEQEGLTLDTLIPLALKELA